MIFINFYLGQGDQALTKAIFFCVSMDDVRLIREQSGNLKSKCEDRGERWMGSDSGHWFSMDLFCPSTHNAGGRDGMRIIKAGLACDALVPSSSSHPPQSAACKLAANSLSALRLLFQNIFPPVHDILPPPPFLFSRDPQLCPFLLFSSSLPLTFPAECREPASCREHCPPQF